MATRPLFFSFRDAGAGIASIWLSERNFRVLIVAAAAALWLGWAFEFLVWEWVALLLMVVVTLSLELLNSALEALTDLYQPDVHPLARLAKNAAAGAVLLSAAAAVAVAALTFGTRLPRAVALLAAALGSAPQALAAAAIAGLIAASCAAPLRRGGRAH